MNRFSSIAYTDRIIKFKYVEKMDSNEWCVGLYLKSLKGNVGTTKLHCIKGTEAQRHKGTKW